MNPAILEASGLVRRFGGVAAVNGAGLRVEPGEVHAVIGPNGAGKTTFLNLLSGEIVPQAGRVLFGGENVTRWGPDARARAGLGRSFQHSALLGALPAFENVRLAAQRRLLPSSFHFFRGADRFAAVTEAAEQAIDAVGLAAPLRPAGALSHGEQRQLEIAMLLASGATLLLLDEPTSGMGRAETAGLIQLLGSLRGTHTIVMVEHDMDVVFSLADRVTVLVLGSVLAFGSPEEVRADPAVRRAYLGERG